MEIYQLKAFVTVAEMGHLTRAAEKLHLSQPALSGQIKALEDELGLALFACSPARLPVWLRHGLARGCCRQRKSCWSMRSSQEHRPQPAGQPSPGLAAGRA